MDRLRRIRLETPVYTGGDPRTDWLLEQGLVAGLGVPRGRRISLTEKGLEAVQELVELERRGYLRGCWNTNLALDESALWIDRRELVRST